MYQGQDNCTFQPSASKNSTKFEGKKEIDLSRKATSGCKVQDRHANYEIIMCGLTFTRLFFIKWNYSGRIWQLRVKSVILDFLIINKEFHNSTGGTYVVPSVFLLASITDTCQPLCKIETICYTHSSSILHLIWFYDRDWYTVWKKRRGVK